MPTFADVIPPEQGLTDQGLLTIAFLALAFVLGGLIAYLWRRISARGKIQRDWATRMEIRLKDLAGGPPAGAPRLACYQIPMRLALVVIAPLGRNTVFAVEGGLPATVEQIAAGLGRVVTAHQTRVTLWPPQISSTGFATTFFGAARLPGLKGKGTPWCAIAGRAQLGDRTLMVGMILCGDEPNNLGQITLSDEYGWREVLHVTE